MPLRPPSRPRAGAPARPLLRAACGAVAIASLANSCHVYVSGGGEFDDPPRATLTVRPDRAAPGQLLQLSASVDDDFGVRRVRFFRVSVSGSVELGSDSDEPYVLSTVLPADAQGEVDFFVKVTDDGGQTRDSDRVGVEVTTP
jgi:hypothetical protein